MKKLAKKKDKPSSNRNYYLTNKKYSDFLENQDRSFFQKYSDFLIKYTNPNQKILDVGCGTGIALEIVKSKAKRDLFGLEVSKDSVRIAKKKKLNCSFYDGQKIPYKNEVFNLVGSYNVLEHTDDPVKFLNEKYRVLKKNGYLFVVCPNFLSTTNGYHWHTQGIKNKFINFLTIISKLASRDVDFMKMDIIVREDFHEDDDACAITNPIDIIKWGRSKKLERVYWSSQEQYPVGIKKILDKSFFKYFLGASFIIYKKV